jgi:methionine biosynthesis protein MetW
MNIQRHQELRADHTVIVDLIGPKSRVLDLGCGDGALLETLIKQKGCQGSGIEIDEQQIYKCVEKGVSVSHGNIDSGLADYSDRRFDYVILHESLQQVLHPRAVILEALRVGKKVIVGIPNFCHINARLQQFFRGRVPVTKELPYEWFDTPNLRFLSIKDFIAFCKMNDIRIVKQRAIGRAKEIILFPNLFAHIGIFLLEK